MRRVVAAAALTLALTACSNSKEPAAQVPTGSPASSGTPSSAAPQGGTPDAPVVAQPTTNLLDWQPVAEDGSVTSNGDWTLTVSHNTSVARIDGPWSLTLPAGAGRRISDALLDGDYAVIVAQDKQEVRPSIATVVTLDGAERRRIPTNANGGTWAMQDGTLVHAVYQGQRYCLESVALKTLETRPVLCMAPRHGFSDATLTPYGDTLLTFDARPSGSCRTPSQFGDEFSPLSDVEACHGWDSLLTQDGQVWSEVPKETQVESAHFYARYQGQYWDLGTGTTGSLTWCGDSAYFVRDSQLDNDKARLLRWTPQHTLEVVYESPGVGNAFLSEPRCGGQVLTLDAQGEGGDEQVNARVD